MTTPFDALVEDIKLRHFHNHRLEDHSDIIGRGILADLTHSCDCLAADVQAGVVRSWLNVPAPGARQRKIDLLVGEPGPDLAPDLERVRLCLENKSVITAHRNRDARFDDLNESLQVLHRVKSEAVLIATVIVGVAERVLNVPDKIKPMYRSRKAEFISTLLPRFSSGDARLWEEFDWAVSHNRPHDPAATVEKFRGLAGRQPGLTHVVGYDYVLLAPMRIDNVNPPEIPRPNSLGIDLDRDYAALLTQACKAYRARWHP
ncbi:MAG: hypothetical protein HZA54_09330 [Planctomycetes bacterium]|nr:hypothetical protein [Planctomycetota bacterium]